MSTLDSAPTQMGDTGIGAATPPVAVRADMVGEVLAGRYELLALLGRGGMGAVYRAHDRELDETVALKLLHPEIAAMPGMLHHFRGEAKLARRVTHRNVARTFEFGEHAGLRFLTMEYVHGEPMSLRLRGGPLPFARVLSWMIGVCEALAAAHAVGIVHRDIKPDNVMLEGDRVVVTDFGIARTSGDDLATLTLAGTPAYMAPEQLTGELLSGRTDLYAVGVTLFEALTGELPWTGDSLQAIATRRLHEPPPDPRTRSPGVPPAVAEVVMRCMAREPGDRFTDASAAAAALRDALARASTGTLEISNPTAIAPATEAAHRTLAVMPFRNSGADEHLVDGLCEDLLDALSAMRGVRVLGRGATLRFRGVDRDTREIGQELGVDAIVDGSVRKTPNGLRISVRLLAVASGFQTWADRYDIAPEGILAVQDTAAQAIFAALSPDVSPSVRQAPSDPIALDLYLRGRHSLRSTGGGDIQRAVDLLSAAHVREPENPLICSSLSMAIIRNSYPSPVFQPETIERARALAMQAIERAPQLGEPQLALAHLALHASDGAATTRFARAAITRAPNLAEAHELLGRMLTEAGRVQEAQRRLEVALALDPLLSGPLWEFIRVAALEGDWDSVDRWIARTGGFEAGRTGRWIFHVRYAGWRGDFELIRRIEREIPDAHHFTPQSRLLVTAMIHGYLAQDGPRQMVRLVDNSLSNPAVGRRLQQLLLQMKAEVAGFHGDDAITLDALRALDDAHLFDLLWLERCPLLAGARARPEFATVHTAVKARADAIVDAMWGQ